MNTVAKITYLTALLLIFSGAAFGQSYFEPSGNPLGSNTVPPVTTGSESALKTGMFWPDSAASDAGTGGGFCFGTDCRVAWPQGTPKKCHLEWKEVRTDSPYPDFTVDTVNGLCDNLLTPQSKAAGWVATGDDYCMGVSNRYCNRPRSCIFARLACTGVTVQTPTTELLAHPASAPADEFQTTNPRPGGATGNQNCFFGRCFGSLK